VLTAFQSYTKGNFGLWTGMWGFSPGDEGDDFECGAGYLAATFPNGVAITYDIINNGGNTTSIKGYPHINFGNYQWSTVQTAVQCWPVGLITGLTTTADHTLVADSALVLEEMWLTSLP